MFYISNIILLNLYLDTVFMLCFNASAFFFLILKYYISFKDFLIKKRVTSIQCTLSCSALRALRTIVPIIGSKVFGNKTNKDETSSFYSWMRFSYAVIYY